MMELSMAPSAASRRAPRTAVFEDSATTITNRMPNAASATRARSVVPPDTDGSARPGLLTGRPLPIGTPPRRAATRWLESKRCATNTDGRCHRWARRKERVAHSAVDLIDLGQSLSLR